MADEDRRALRSALQAKIRSKRTSRTGPHEYPAQLIRDPMLALMRLGLDDAAILVRAPEIMHAAKALAATPRISKAGPSAAPRREEPGLDDDEAPPPEAGEP